MRTRGALALVLLSIAGCGSDHERPPPQTTTLESAAPPPPVQATGSSVAPGGSASAVAALSADAPPDPESPPRAFDMHCDTPYQVLTKGRSLDLPSGQITPDTLKRGHVGGVFLAIYISDKLHSGHPTIADADEIFDTVDKILSRHTDLFWPATKGPTPDGMVTAIVSMEGAGAFADDITQIDRFIARGVRVVGPVHMKNDRLSSSATDKHTGGLTALGKKFCERVYQKGALVDVSHMSDEGFADVVEIAKRFGAPVVATHSDARAVADVPRNLTDADLVAIAASDGVAGVNFYKSYLRVGDEATIDDAVKQAMYMIKVAGIDHVGIGSDFDGSTPPADLADASFFPAFATGLTKAGLSKADVHKLFSENVKRVLRWQTPKPKP